MLSQSSLCLLEALTADNLFTGLAIAKRRVSGQFATTEMQLLALFIQAELQGLEL